MNAMAKKRSKPSKTSSFGVGKRENHDSSLFYSSGLYDEIFSTEPKEFIDNSPLIPKDILNTVILGDSSNMKQLPDNSIHLAITSPPYNVCKVYDKGLPLSEFLKMLQGVFEEVWRVLVTGGRFAVNVAGLGRKPYIPLQLYITDILSRIGFSMRGDIIWNKGTFGGSCAWGSWMSPSNPCLRDVHEYIGVFSKGSFKLPKGEKKSTIKKEEFQKWTQSIWNFPPESAKKIGHPAPFPEELPARLITLYSYEGDMILDPFMGSGTTGLVAIKLKRNFVGYENREEYVELATRRINKEKNQVKIDDFLS